MSSHEVADGEKHAETAVEHVVVDTVHNDEAVQILATYTGNREWEPAEEAKVLRKIDLRLMPILCLTYMLQYYDKGLLSQAAIFGIREDLNLGGYRFSFSASIFYLGFVAGCYPVMLIAQRYPIERVAFGIVAVWGVCLTLTIVCTNYQGLFIERFFLGFLEAGVTPMNMMLVGGWYKKDEQAFRMGWWYCFTGYTLLLSPIVNWGLGHITGGPFASWQWMYLFAGCLTIAWSFVILFFLPPDPIRARGFTERERFIIVSRMRSNNSGVRNTHFKWRQVVELMTDMKFWTLFVIAIVVNNSNGLASTYLTIVIAGLGFSRFKSLLLLIPIGFATGSGNLFASFLASRFPNKRTLLMAIFEIQMIVVALLFWLLPRSAIGGQLFATYLMWGFSATWAILMGVSVANTAGYTKRSWSASGISIGYCVGNFIGPFTFRAEDAPRYKPAFIIVFVFSIVAALLCLFYGWMCARDNKARDAAGTREDFEHAYEDDLTDKKNPQFRYNL